MEPLPTPQLSCSGFLPSLHVLVPLLRTLFSTLAHPAGDLPKIHSFLLAYRTMEILDLRAGGS